MKKFTRFLSVLLCIVMVCSLLPPAAVSAAKPERNAPAQPKFGKAFMSRAIGTVEGYTYFETFEELKQLAAGTYSEPTPILYLGSDTLEITEDLTLPENMILVVSNMKVLSGVSMNAPYLLADEVKVDGTLSTLYAEIYVALHVNGTYHNLYEIHLFGNVFQTGKTNIVHDEYACGYMWTYPGHSGDLSYSITEARADANQNNQWYHIISITTDMNIGYNMTLPWNSDLFIDKGVKVTVAENVTLAVEGFLLLDGTVTVNGALVNDGAVEIYYDNGGRLAINGICTGAGNIYVNSPVPEDAITGLTGYNRERSEDGSYWILTPAEGAVPLGTPTDLRWNYFCVGGENAGVEMVHNGSISWKNGLPDSGEYLVQMYCDGELYESYDLSATAQEVVMWRTLPNFGYSYPESGSYYFTVTVLGDGEAYADSAAAMSEEWYYTKPETALGICTNLSMDAEYLYWDAPADLTHVTKYEVQILYAATADAEPEIIGNMEGHYGSSGNYDSTAWADYLADEGYYYFSVRLISRDITQACNGQWSELSEPYYYGEPERKNGDFNNDGVVDDADVAYLLWHTLFVDSYPIDISGDLNSDGNVDDADVAYLLWHTLFPDSYPL